ncbi:MAG: HD-GYP domain-containing protein [Pseudomonas sp.]|nr:HD-GYP domain-containing protein [Pseudomonas sp.]
MLKKIAIDDAATGMFIHQFCGSWIDHPFWSKQLRITDDATLRRIRSSGIHEIIIDTERGVDVAGVDSLGVNSPGLDSLGVNSLNEPPLVVEHPATDSSQLPQVSTDTQVPVPTPACSVFDEISRAGELVARGKRDVIRMFADVRMGRAVESENIQALVSDMSDSLMRNAHALLGMVRIKRSDEYTYLHSVAVAALMMALSRSHGCDEQTIKLAGMAGLLHDLGKVAMPDYILNKPGKLTEAEFDVMRGHPKAGAKLLQALTDMPAEVIDACLHHHEKIDGNGYPDKLVGDEISLITRMAAICDVYDAITSNRPYHKGDDPSITLSRMAKWPGHFDAALFQLFVRTLGIYPIGSLVRLSSDRLAIVIEQNSGALLRPRLRVFFSVSQRQWIAPEILDLAIDGSDVAIIGREEPEAWGLSGLDRLWLNSHDPM